jgi:hypothetical protein
VRGAVASRHKFISQSCRSTGSNKGCKPTIVPGLRYRQASRIGIETGTTPQETICKGGKHDQYRCTVRETPLNHRQSDDQHPCSWPNTRPCSTGNSTPQRSLPWAAVAGLLLGELTCWASLRGDQNRYFCLCASLRSCAMVGASCWRRRRTDPVVQFGVGAYRHRRQV